MVICLEKRENLCRVSVGKVDVKSALGKSGHRWVTNIKMGLKEIDWKNVGWISLENSGRLL